jgi:hypothetical protein
MSIESLSETTAEAAAPALPSEPLFSRELSWLAFNERVLAEVDNPRQPLLERVKFAAIFTSNLDEFFMVRVSCLKQQLTADQSALCKRSPLPSTDPPQTPARPKATPTGRKRRGQPLAGEGPSRPAPDSGSGPVDGAGTGGSGGSG